MRLEQSLQCNVFINHWNSEFDDRKKCERINFPPGAPLSARTGFIHSKIKFLHAFFLDTTNVEGNNYATQKIIARQDSCYFVDSTFFIKNL